MSLCLFAAGKIMALGAGAFTLAWAHSVEKTAWEEDWRLTPAGLVIVEARVKGSGAGMEPPEGAHYDGAWWRYTPAAAPLAELRLIDSGATSPWIIRAGAQTFTTRADTTSVIAACP
jgi:hypothetical protein